jgi:uncharacterized protein with GYD domain
MTVRLRARDQRTAMVGSAFIVLALAGRHVIPAVAAWNAAQLSSAAEDRLRVGEGRAARLDLPRLRDSTRARRLRLDALDTMLLAAATPVEAAAALASTLEDIADSAPVRVASLQIRVDSARRGFARVGVRISGAADVRGLADFLSVVEGDDPPWMAVRELSVTQSDPAATPNKPEALHVDLLVEALAIMRRAPRT